MSSIAAALTGRLPVEVDFHATVLSQPTFFTGTNTHARHESFDCRTDDGSHIEVIDNVDLAPPLPVVPGDRIAVRGELVADRGRPPIVHWTHHDPAARHIDGWIDFGGVRYA